VICNPRTINPLRSTTFLETALMRRSLAFFRKGDILMAVLSIQPVLAIGGWGSGLLGWLDPWEIVVGLVVVVLGLRFVKHIAEHWTR
jgi:hypothetical protein